eukprot:687948-Rhodomonas_salina.2
MSLCLCLSVCTCARGLRQSAVAVLPPLRHAQRHSAPDQSAPFGDVRTTGHAVNRRPVPDGVWRRAVEHVHVVGLRQRLVAAYAMSGPGIA